MRCTVDDCSNTVLAKGLCGKHYQRMAKYGSTEDPSPTVEQRFWKKVAVSEEGCWLWTGATVKSKTLRYGAFRAMEQQLAHRVSHLLFKGSIPEGFHVDHLCSTPLCVNPEHLEAVSPKENNRRTWARGRRRHAKVDLRFRDKRGRFMENRPKDKEATR